MIRFTFLLFNYQSHVSNTYGTSQLTLGLGLGLVICTVWSFACHRVTLVILQSNYYLLTINPADNILLICPLDLLFYKSVFFNTFSLCKNSVGAIFILDVPIVIPLLLNSIQMFKGL